jgi:hypothetical protein
MLPNDDLHVLKYAKLVLVSVFNNWMELAPLHPNMPTAKASQRRRRSAQPKQSERNKGPSESVSKPVPVHVVT